MSACDELVQQADGSFLTREEVQLHLVIKDVYSSVDPRLHVMSPADRAQVVKAVLAAGYRKPRTITKSAELAGLSDGTVMMSGDRIRMHAGVLWRVSGGMMERVGKELHGVVPFVYFVDPLPATVIYEHEATA